MSKLLRFVTTALFWVVASIALAQSTGSSFGGGDWGGGGGGGSSSSSSYSGSSSYSSSGVSSGDANAIELPYWAQLLVFVAFIALLFGLIRFFARLQSGGFAAKIDLTRYQIALDARARPFVQTTLRNLGRRGDTATRIGRVELLKATIAALRSVKIAWIYAGTKNFDPMPPSEAQAAFKRLADETRAGFQIELERAADGERTHTDAPDMVAREHEGEGTVLVTVLVAARTKLRDVWKPDAKALDDGLAWLTALTPDQLVALEVVWTPATENDRMSTDELEKHYPTLTKLEGAIGGRVYCSSCRGPYAAELVKCPHCGAPAG